MPTYQTIANHIKFITGQDSLSSADTLRVINFALDWYSNLALTSDGRWKFQPSTDTEALNGTTNIVANQNRYEIDVNYLKLDGIEAYIDGEWRVLQQIDRRENKTTSLSALYPTPGNPTAYDYDGKYVYLYPTPDFSAEDALKAAHSRPVEYVTALTETIGIPRIHIEAVAVHGASQVSMRTNDSNRGQLQNQVALWEQKVKDYFSSRDEDRPRRLKPKTNSTFNTRSF